MPLILKPWLGQSLVDAPVPIGWENALHQNLCLRCPHGPGRRCPRACKHRDICPGYLDRYQSEWVDSCPFHKLFDK